MTKIKKEQYFEAEKLADEYKKQINTELYKELKCCVCKRTKIRSINDVESLDLLALENEMYSDGTVVKIEFGFGSSIDTSQFYIAICDDCMLNLEQKGLAINYKDLYTKMRAFYKE